MALLIESERNCIGKPDLSEARPVADQENTEGLAEHVCLPGKSWIVIPGLITTMHGGMIQLLVDLLRKTRLKTV